MDYSNVEHDDGSYEFILFTYMIRPILTVHILQKLKSVPNFFVKSEPDGSQITLRNSNHDLQSLIPHHNSF